MATIINTPGNASDSNDSNGLITGLILIIVVALLFWLIGMPYLRGSGATPDTNIENNMQAPADQAPAESGDTNINVPIPDEINVNVTNGQGGQ